MQYRFHTKIAVKKQIIDSASRDKYRNKHVYEYTVADLQNPTGQQKHKRKKKQEDTGVWQNKQQIIYKPSSFEGSWGLYG